MSTSITIIVTPAEDLDSFEAMYVEDRRNNGGGWDEFPVRSARYLEAFLLKATKSDLGVIKSTDDRDDEGKPLISCLIFRTTLVEVLPDLERLVEADAEETARALHTYGGSAGDLGRITHALKTGDWPTSGDPAEEAAGFAHHLLKFARTAKRDHMGVCWEYRGQFMS